MEQDQLRTSYFLSLFGIRLQCKLNRNLRFLLKLDLVLQCSFRPDWFFCLCLCFFMHLPPYGSAPKVQVKAHTAHSERCIDTYVTSSCLVSVFFVLISCWSVVLFTLILLLLTLLALSFFTSHVQVESK